MKLLDGLLKRLSVHLSEEEATEVRESAEKRTEWATKRFVSRLEKGTNVEVLRNLDVWSPATVVEVLSRCDGKQMVKVHFDGWGDVHDEWLSASSRRIVPEGFALSNSSWIIRNEEVLDDRWEVCERSSHLREQWERNQLVDF